MWAQVTKSLEITGQSVVFLKV